SHDHLVRRNSKRGGHGQYRLAIHAGQGLQPPPVSAVLRHGRDRDGHSGLGRVASGFGLRKKEKPAVIWLHFQECTGCSESFIRASHPIVADALLDIVNLNYSETLMAPSGFQAEKSLTDTMRDQKGKYILLVEGAVPTKDNGVYCMVRGKTAESILQEVAADAAAVVAWGACASFGGVQAAKPNPTGAHAISKLINKPVINVPGCPPHRRRDDGGGFAPARPRADSRARLPRPSQGVLRSPRARHLLSSAELRCGPVRRVLRRREREEGLLPL